MKCKVPVTAKTTEADLIQAPKLMCSGSAYVSVDLRLVVIFWYSMCSVLFCKNFVDLVF